MCVGVFVHSVSRTFATRCVLAANPRCFGHGSFIRNCLGNSRKIICINVTLATAGRQDLVLPRDLDLCLCNAMLCCPVVVGLFNGSALSLQSRRKAAVTLLHGATQFVPALPLPHPHPLPVSVAVPVTAAQRRRRLSFACDHNISLP